MRSKNRLLFLLVTTALVVGVTASGLALYGCSDARRIRPASAPPPLPAVSAGDIVSRLDARLHAAWAEAGLTPAPAVDDAGYLRRVTLDLTGVVPSADEVRTFLADTSSDKRPKLVRRLLNSPRYVQHWTNYWDELLMGPPVKRGGGRLVDRLAFRRWLYARLAEDRPYHDWIYQLLTARGQNSQGGRPDYASWDLDSPEATASYEGVNGAVNFSIFHAREPQNLAGKVAGSLLGVQIQCAECHDHPTEKWTQKEFQQFTANFMRTSIRRLDRGMTRGVRRAEVYDVDLDNRRQRRQLNRRMEKSGYSDADPIALDGTDLSKQDDRRAALARWITAPDNPWFVSAVVNRLWATLLGRGFVHPVDGFGQSLSSTDVQSADILRLLSDDFVANDMSLRHLLEVICNSAAYARASSGGDGKEASYAAWHRFRPRPMDANQLLDSLVAVGQLRPMVEELVGDRFARIKYNLRRQFTFAFNAEDDDSVDEAFTGTVPQSLMLMNGVVTSGASAALRGSTVGQIARYEAGPSDKLNALYQAALSRPASADEQAYWEKYLDADRTVLSGVSGSQRSRRKTERTKVPLGRLYRRAQLRDFSTRDEAYEDIFWVLLNSSEFFFIH